MTNEAKMAIHKIIDSLNIADENNIAERDKEIVEMVKETQKTIRLEQFTVDTIINIINSKK